MCVCVCVCVCVCSRDVQLRHTTSMEYGNGGCGPCPISFKDSIPSVVVMDVPLLSSTSIATMANVLALDTCPRELKRLIINIMYTFGIVPENRVRFRRELARVAVDLAKASRVHVQSTCKELTDCLSARQSSNGAVQPLPKIPSEKPQCDRRFVDIIEVGAGG